MAAEAIGSLRVNLGLDSAQFEAGLTRATIKAELFVKGIGFAANKLGELMGSALTAIPNVLQDIDDLGKSAEKIGMPIEALSELRHAAEMAGIPFDALQGGLLKLSDTMATALVKPSGDAANSFRALGITAQDLDGGLTTVVPKLADAFSQYADGANKVALSRNLMGKSGDQLIPLLNGGSAALREAAEEARNLGLVITNETYVAADQFNDNMDRLKKTGSGLNIMLASALVPSMARLTDILIDSGNAFGNSAELGKRFEGMLVRVSKFAIHAWHGISMVTDAAKMLSGFLNLDVMATSDQFAKVFSDFQERLQANKASAKAALADLDAPAATQAVGLNSRTKPPPPGVGGGDAEAKKKLTDAQRAYNETLEDGRRLTEEMRTPQEVLNDELQEYDRLLNTVNVKTGETAISTETYGRAVEAAFKKFQDASKDFAITWKDIGQQLQSTLGGWIDNLIDGTFKLKDAIAGLIKDFAKMAAQKAMSMALSFAIPGFASGTNFAPGGMALVGERGPELVNLPRGSQVIPNHEIGGAMGGITINQTIAANGDETVARIARQATMEGLNQYDRGLSGRIAEKQWRNGGR